MNKFVNLAIAAAAALAASPAAAQNVHISHDGSYRVTIASGDLNLATPAGLKRLEGRVKSAATAICGRDSGVALVQVRSAKDCQASVMAAARPQFAMAGGARERGAVADR